MNSFLFYLDAFKAPIMFASAWIFAVWICPKFFIDSFRQRMFALRDEMFSDAANGLISFDHPAYGMLRSTMNGFIRYAHKITLSHMAILMWELRGFALAKEDTFEHRWSRYTSSVSVTAQARLNDYKKRMEDLVIEKAIRGSPLLMVTIVPWIIGLVLLHFCFRWIVALFSVPMRSLDDTAMIVGEAA